jgi:hypothetical protein
MAAGMAMIGDSSRLGFHWDAGDDLYSLYNRKRLAQEDKH